MKPLNDELKVPFDDRRDGFYFDGWETLSPVQMVYAFVYGVGHFMVLFVGPFLMMVGLEDDTTYCIAIGLLHGMAIVAAAWSVLADIHLALRLPLGVLAAIFCAASLLTTFAIETGLRDDMVLVYASMPIFVFILLQAPFWILRLLFSWRMRISPPEFMPAQMEVRFSIRHLFYAVTVAAVLMGVIRAVGFAVSDFTDDEFIFAIHLVVAAAGIGVVTVCASLVSRRLPVVLVGCLLLNVLITGIEILVCGFTLRMPSDLAFFICIINFATMMIVGGSVVAARPLGVRLWSIAEQ